MANASPQHHRPAPATVFNKRAPSAAKRNAVYREIPLESPFSCMISFHTESTVITWSMDLYYPKVPQRTPGRLMRLPIGGEDNNDAVINKVPCVVIRVHPPSAFACERSVVVIHGMVQNAASSIRSIQEPFCPNRNHGAASRSLSYA